MYTNDLNRAAIAVRKNEVIRLGTARGQRIESVLGRLWVTMDSDTRDIVLDPGEGFSIDRDDAVLVSASRDDARFVLLGAVAAA
ncbi:MAG: DUF2917 domain-containing protein [Bacteriovorax sp.]|nr:DUF2917 domain-containing protein [Rhizobacter sp.]